MDVAEHAYDDDPQVGHPDVRTRLGDVDYFFLGNGHIQGAVQVCRSGEGTPLGLLVLDPNRLGHKRTALTFDLETGLRQTVVTLRVGDALFTPDPTEIEARWDTIDGAPAVLAAWQAGPASVVEGFFCPDRTAARLCRRVDITVADVDGSTLTLQTGMAESECAVTLLPSSSGTATAVLVYEIEHRSGVPIVEMRWERSTEPRLEAVAYWSGLAQCVTGDPGLDHLFNAARSQLSAAITAGGRMDGSIWQYSLEWVRDQAHVTEALVRLGDRDLARTMLERLLDEFVSPDGDTVDSGRRREPADVELDQNGVLLAALKTYVDWTGDLAFVAERWQKVAALAEFPLCDEFRHEASGLLHNAREYWERHRAFGITDGMELMHQFWVAVGLQDAAHLAGLSGRPTEGARWEAEAGRLKHAMLEHQTYRLVEDGHLIKRRSVDGTWQRRIEPGDVGLPLEVPIRADTEHLLDPDTSSALLIAHWFIDPTGDLAQHTLRYLEQLWNLHWEGGGYSRYHTSSEPDSPGPWPFASLFVARAYVESGDDDMVWRILRWLAREEGGRAGTWLEFIGSKPSPPCPQAGVTPWTWAELVTLFIHHLLGVRPDSDGVTLRPRLLDGLDGMRASVLVRGHRLDLDVRRAASPSERGAHTGSQRFPWQHGGVRLPQLTGDARIEILC
jgi:hypothetical protein